MQRQTPHNTGVKHMEFTIKGRREKESINEIRSKPKPADVTAKTALMSPSVCTAVQNRRRPPACQSESCHLRPNERSRKSGIDFGTSRPGNPTPCHRLRIRPYPPQGQSPTLPHRSDASGASVGTTSPTAAGKTPVLGNFQSARLFWRRTYSTARFASALPAAKGRTNTPSSSFWKARFINLFAGKSPPLPFIRRYTIPVVNAA